MKTLTALAAAAVALSLGCAESADPGQLMSPEIAKGKPDLAVPALCEMKLSSMSGRLLALCEATNDESTLFLSRNNANKDRWGLMGKLNRAETKCDVDGDAFGAIGKLTDFRDKVLSLRAEGKISEPDGVDLAGDALGLIADLGPDPVNPELPPVLLCPTPLAT
ncbi:MAG: hypothetical protein OEO20_04045 [Gemmatimonadota bacterium]|nr:hypothetical protein [Gemmatimonadota bacterium]MDH3367487.1 hypothetical protein [Gemmatimonadota bacterium]MDH3477457.1 hypothetical protein [Gemmatimonadota bacterium]MDH3569414.1 hypothetical protein [Gemmatimonadota bacterium]MDH5549252.1 hypothetical protein [Gemmatimonadota bacterium]